MTRRLICRTLGLVALLVGLWLLASLLVGYRLTRRASPVYPEMPPRLAWGTIEAVRLRTDDGEDLGAWYIDGQADRPLVLLLHGNGCDRGSCLYQAELVSAAGCPVMLVTQRAHGDSSGEVNDFGFSARHDVVAAVRWLEQKHPRRPIVVWGRSLGAAAAIFAAKDLGGDVRGYILECPYLDLATALRNRTRLHLPPVLDLVAYSGLTAMAPIVLPEMDEISPVQRAAAIPPKASVLLLAGRCDRRACPEEADAIRDRIGARARLVVIDDGDHLRLHEADPKLYRAAVLALIAGLE
jgi:alpha-beta hydrolase superfamily lysophospholipase